MITSRHPLLPPPTSHNLKNTWGKSCYGPHSAKLGGVPNTNHNSYSWHKIITSLAITYDCLIEWRPFVRATTSTLTLVTHTILSQNSRNIPCPSSILSHNLKDVILSHNSKNATCLPSIPSHNSRDTITSHNSKNTPASLPLRYHPKLCRPRTSKSHKPLPMHYRLVLLQRRQAKANSRSPGRSLSPPSATSCRAQCYSNHRLAERSCR